MSEKAFAYFCYDPTGVTLRGTIPDAPIPVFGLAADGYGEMSLKLPRTLGQARADVALELDNRVDVYVATPEALAVTATAARYGRARYGQAAYGVSGGARLVYRGVITTLTPSLAGADVELRIVPLGQRIAGGTHVTLTASGDPVTLARQIVAGTGLLWDSANPETAGLAAPVAVAFRRTALGQALATLRDLAGPGWFAYVTPERRVRMFCPDTTATATHRLSAGRATDGRLTYSAADRRKAVTVVYAAGAVTVVAADQDAADPRELIVQESAITDEGTARQMAAARLADLDRVVLRGEITLTGEATEIEQMRAGDTVQLLLDEDGDQGVAGRYGRARYGAARYGAAVGGGWGRALVVAAVQYRHHDVRLELTEPAPRQTAALRQAIEAAARFAAAHGDTQLTRDSSGRLAARETLAVPALTAAGSVTAAGTVSAAGVSVGGVTIDPAATNNPNGGTQSAPSGWADATAEAWATALRTKLITANVIA